MPEHELLGSWALREARDLLPAWVIWGSTLLYLGIAFLLPFALGHLAMIRMCAPLHASLGMPWTERARHFHSLRSVLVGGSLVIVAYTAILAAALPNRLSPMPVALLVTLVLLIGDTVHFQRGRRIARRIAEPDSPIRTALLGQAAQLVLGSGLYLAVLLALLIPAEPKGPALVGSVLGALALIFLGLGGGVIVLEVLGLARRLPTTEVDADPKQVIVVHSDLLFANALALPFLRRILVTDSALAALSPDQLSAVLHHERAHLVEPWATKYSRLTGLLIFLVFALWSPLVAAVGAEIWLCGLLLLVALHLGTSSWRRRAEERADKAAHSHAEGLDTYARALEILHRVNLVPAIMGRKHSHPDLYDRMLAAGVQPEYERPEPPPRASAWIRGAYATCAIVLVVSGILLADESRVDREDRGQVHFALAFRGNTASWLEDLGLIEDLAGEFERAVVFRRAASTLDTASPYLAADLSWSLSACGEQEESRAALGEAERRARSWPKEAELDECLAAARKSLQELEQERSAEGATNAAEEHR